MPFPVCRIVLLQYGLVHGCQLAEAGLTRIPHDGREVPPEESTKERGHGTEYPEGGDDDGIVLGVVHVVVVDRRHHVVGHHLTWRTAHNGTRHMARGTRQYRIR